jgi:protein TonB
VSKLLGALVVSLIFHLVVFGGFRAYERRAPTLATAGDRIIVATLVGGLLARRGGVSTFTADNHLSSPTGGKLSSAAKEGGFPTGSPQLMPSSIAIKIPVGTATGQPAEALLGPEVQGARMQEFVEPPSEDGVRQYRLSLARAARSYKQYPTLNREGVLEGDVIITVSAAAGGGAPVVVLGRTSGQPLLDRLALDLMIKATGLAPLPDILRGKPFVISLPVQYRQNE